VAKIVRPTRPDWDRSAILDEIEGLRKRLGVRQHFDIAKVLAEAAYSSFCSQRIHCHCAVSGHATVYSRAKTSAPRESRRQSEAHRSSSPGKRIRRRTKTKRQDRSNQVHRAKPTAAVTNGDGRHIVK
jgi:hypothetical protein